MSTDDRIVNLIPAHMRALRAVARGGVLVTTHKGMAPQAVTDMGKGMHVKADTVSAPALSVLRRECLVTFTQHEGAGPWPLEVTDLGRKTLGQSTQLTVGELRKVLNDFGADDVVRVVYHGYEKPSFNLPAISTGGPVAVGGQLVGYSLLIVCEEPRGDRA